MKKRWVVVLAIVLSLILVVGACSSIQLAEKSPSGSAALADDSGAESSALYDDNLENIDYGEPGDAEIPGKHISSDTQAQAMLGSTAIIYDKPEYTDGQVALNKFISYAVNCGLESGLDLSEESRIDFLFGLSYLLTKEAVESNYSSVPEIFKPEKMLEPNLYVLNLEQLNAMLNDYLGMSVDRVLMESKGLIDSKHQHILSIGEGTEEWSLDELPIISHNGEIAKNGKAYSAIDFEVASYRCDGGMASDRLVNAWLYANDESAFGYTLQTLEYKPLLNYIASSNSNESPSNQYSGGVENLVDMSDGTSWQLQGNGVGASIKFKFEKKVWIDSFSIQPGDTSSLDSFLKGRKVESVRLTFSDGQSIDLDIPNFEEILLNMDLKSGDAIASNILVDIALPQQFFASEVTVTILKTSDQNDDKPEQICIGGIDFFNMKRPHF